VEFELPTRAKAEEFREALLRGDFDRLISDKWHINIQTMDVRPVYPDTKDVDRWISQIGRLTTKSAGPDHEDGSAAGDRDRGTGAPRKR
jgi:hypothetical protein